MLIIVLALGLTLRLYLLLASHGYVDGDEALVGLQALDILQGRHSVFFAGELLAGSVEAYLVALFFWLFGASPFTLRIVPLAFSLGFILLNYHLARRVFGQAVGLLSALLVALSPLLLSVVSLKTWGGYIETATMGEAALLLTLLVLSRDSVDRLSIGYIAAAGLISGLATWMHPLYFYYLFTLGVVLSWYRFRRSFSEFVAFAVPFLVGCAPLWLSYLRQSTGPSASSVAGLVPLDQLPSAALASLSYLVTDAVRALWGLRPSKGPLLLSLAWIVIPVYLSALAYVVYRQVATRAEGRSREGRVLLVFLLLSPFIFVLGAMTNGNYTVIIPGSGLLDRYLAPLYTVLPIFVAAAAWAAWRRTRWLSIAMIGIVIGVSLWSNFSANPVASMRSPFENVPLPASNAELVNFLQSQGIRHAYATHWIGYRIMFDTQQAVQTSDYVENTYGMDRLPRSSQAVEEATEAPAYILFNPGWKRPPPLDGRLQALGVTFSKIELQDYLVYYSLSRRVHPSEVIDTLVWPYWYS